MTDPRTADEHREQAATLLARAARYDAGSRSAATLAAMAAAHVRLADSLDVAEQRAAA